MGCEVYEREAGPAAAVGRGEYATSGRVGWYGVGMTRPMLADAFAHHVWATQTLIDACLPLTAEQLEATVPGTYGSIIDTMRHLVGGDRSYLLVLTGADLPDIDEAQEASMDLAALRAVIDADGPAWAEFLARDLDPDETVIRYRDDGSESHAPRGIRVAQVIHHGTDHRSQICTALTSLGITPPEIDAWDFANAEGRLSETPPTVPA
jgi:uncharacterized damage-inducible protein DinB